MLRDLGGTDLEVVEVEEPRHSTSMYKFLNKKLDLRRSEQVFMF